MDESTITALMKAIDEVNDKYETACQEHNHAVDVYNKNFDIFRNVFNKNFGICRNAINENTDVLNKLKHKHDCLTVLTTIEIMYLMYKTWKNKIDISTLSKKVTGLSNVVAKELLKEENKKGE